MCKIKLSILLAFLCIVGFARGQNEIQLSAAHVALIHGITTLNQRVDAQTSMITTFTTQLSETNTRALSTLENSINMQRDTIDTVTAQLSKKLIDTANAQTNMLAAFTTQCRETTDRALSRLENSIDTQRDTIDTVTAQLSKKLIDTANAQTNMLAAFTTQCNETNTRALSKIENSINMQRDTIDTVTAQLSKKLIDTANAQTKRFAAFTTQCNEITTRVLNRAEASVHTQRDMIDTATAQFNTRLAAVLGKNVVIRGANAIAIGDNAQAVASGAVALGVGAQSAEANTMVIGGTNATGTNISRILFNVGNGRTTALSVVGAHRSLTKPQRIVSGRFDGRENQPTIYAGVGFSASRLSMGRYRITFDEPFASADYTIYAQGLSYDPGSGSTLYAVCPVFSTYTADSVEVIGFNQMSHRQDDAIIDFMVFGSARTE